MNRKRIVLGLVLAFGLMGGLVAGEPQGLGGPSTQKGVAKSPEVQGTHAPVEEAIPQVGDFIPFEVAPQLLPEHDQQPAFPEAARAAGVTGRVVVQIFVDKQGLVKQHKILSAEPDSMGFQQEVVKVLDLWKFSPAIQEGTPVGVWVQIPINFTLAPKEQGEN